jgi:hypothetical protein
MLLVIVLGFGFIVASWIVGGVPAAFIVLGLKLWQGEGALDNPEALAGAAFITTALDQTIFLVLAFGPIFLIVWAWLAAFEKRPFWTLGLERAGALKKYGRGLLIGLVLFGGAVGVSAMLGHMAVEPPDSQAQGLAALGGVLLVLLGWMVQGAAEEALTRGWMLPVLGARYGPGWGIVVSALFFAVLHSLNPNLNPVAMLNLFLFGVFAALYALWEGGLWGIFAIHTVWNWAQGHLFGLQVSGMTVPGGALFNLLETGPDLITGGSFGPEGGLAVTLVLLAGIAGVGWAANRRKRDWAIGRSGDSPFP